MAFKVNHKRDQKIARLKKLPPKTHDVYKKTGLSKNQIKQMELELAGRIVVPGMPDYPAARAGKGGSKYQEYPVIIVYCASVHDVWLCLKWAHEYDWWVTCRSGGHSTANFSVNSGMVIDVSGLAYVRVDSQLKQAQVGAGTPFSLVNSTLNTYQLHVPGGGCADVAVGGYVQGGGYGFTSRLFGVESDCVLSFTMMLYDGQIVVANPYQNQDLFWAVRGGTGDNFGILLEVTFQLYDLYKVWGFGLLWQLDEAAEALHAIQSGYVLDEAASRLGYQNFFTTLDSGAVLAMIGMYYGSREDGLKAIAKLRQVGKPTLKIDQVDTYQALNDDMLNFLPGVPPGNTFESKDGGYIDKLLTVADWQKIVEMYRQTPNRYNIAYMEVYGAAINRYPVSGSAFIHRNVYMDFYIDSFWQPDGSKFTTEKEATQWLAEYIAVLEPYYNGHQYQNYPKRDSQNYRWAFWGEAFNSLLFVKHKYDPTNFFHFEQSISPYPEGDDIKRATTPSLFTDPQIVYEPYSISVLSTAKKRTAKA
jgi:hypothetical protein